MSPPIQWRTPANDIPEGAKARAPAPEQDGSPAGGGPIATSGGGATGSGARGGGGTQGRGAQPPRPAGGGPIATSGGCANGSGAGGGGDTNVLDEHRLHEPVRLLHEHVVVLLADLAQPAQRLVAEDASALTERLEGVLRLPREDDVG